MPTAAHDRPRRPTRIRAVAIVTLATLSCTTVRVPATGIPPSVMIRGDAAEPQVELWVESGKDVSPEEAAKAAADARGALQQALAARNLGEGEQLLVVRAQGVSRTGSRRADQTAATAGLVVAAVAIVAVVVVVLVASQGKGGGNVPAIHAAPAAIPRAAPAPGAIAVRPAAAAIRAIPRPPPIAGPAAAVRPAPPPGTPPPASLPRPSGSPGHGHGDVAVLVGADVQVPIPGPRGPQPSVWSDTVLTGPPPPAPPPPPEPAVTEVVLPPPAPLDLSRRGFFAGDSTRLELTLLDRATGRALWVKVVEAKSDPRDARAVRALLDRGLEDASGWEPAP